MEAISCTEA